MFYLLNKIININSIKL